MTIQPEQAAAYVAATDVETVGMPNAEVTTTSVKPTTTKPTKQKGPKPVSEYIPKYTDEEKEVLSRGTIVVEQEKERVIQEKDKYGSVKYGNNVMIDLKQFVKNGGKIWGVAVNRKHGRDQETTGASLFANGAQENLLGVTYRVARAYGIQVAPLSDKEGKDCSPADGDLVLEDGHGRVGFLLGYPCDEWPDIYMHFPAKDGAGFYNIPKAMEAINVNAKKWETQDFMQKRIMEEGQDSHEGWNFINSLVKKGYKYQAACQIATLGTDRIKKREILSGNPDNVFANFDDASKLFKTLVAKFGEGDDKTLKTKEFTKEISILWGKLQKVKGNAWATEEFIKFINVLTVDKVEEIKSAKRTTDGVSRDEKRKQLFDAEFHKFIETNNIGLE